MKTHKVVDIVSIVDDGAQFYGTYEECHEWATEQGFGYEVVALTKDEIELANEK
jgi:hypothetical protein